MVSGYCPKCGRKRDSTSGQCTHWECYSYYVKTGPPQGWQCPLCRVVHAPWVQLCECAKSGTVVATASDYGTGWTTIEHLKKEEKE